MWQNLRPAFQELTRAHFQKTFRQVFFSGLISETLCLQSPGLFEALHRPVVVTKTRQDRSRHR